MHKDANATQRGDRLDATGGSACGQREPEARPFPEGARHPDRTTKVAHEALGYCKAKARAAVSSGEGGIRLREFLENTCQRFLCDANASVRHFEANETGIVVRQDGDANATLVGKLYRVTRKIEKDLTNATLVRQEPASETWVHIGADFDPLLATALAQQLRHALDQRLRREGDLFEHHGSRFDFREIEDIVDDTEQRLA